MKEIYDKSVEKIAKYSDELSDIDPYVFDKAIPLIRRELQDIIKSHTLAMIDAEIERVEGMIELFGDPLTSWSKGRKEALTDHLTYLKEQRELISNS